MPNAVITVAGITPPAMGKKQGHIIDTAGSKWNVWGDKLHNYRMGVTYNINYEENEFNNAKFYVIKNAEPAGAPAAAAPPQVPQGFQQPMHPVTAQATQGQVFTSKDEMIFVCGALNHAMGNPNTDSFAKTVIELTELVNNLRAVWRGTLGKRPGNPDMNDGIPF